MLLSVIVPCYNEEPVIRETHGRLVAVLEQLNFDYELIYIDDGSTDKTSQILCELQSSSGATRVIFLSRNFGHQIAVTAGLEHASGDAVVIIDADLQDPPEVILEMVARWRDGYDVVYGVRTDREGETRFKLWTARVFYRLINRLSNIEMPLDVGDFRLMDRKVVAALKAMPERDRFLRGMVSWVGFRQIAVMYKRAARHAGASKYPLLKMIRFATDGVISFSFTPLRLAIWTGFVTIGVAMCGILYAVLARLYTTDWVRGWASIFVAVLLMSGVQLITLGIIGEYIGRIYGEVKHRPLYFLQERLGFEKDRERTEAIATPPSQTAQISSERLPKLEGADYKRGAIEYARKLDAADRYHLLTKPFYNLTANKKAKYPGEGMDADTHRHFCDFANMAVTLALPEGARILDVGCGSGWLCEYFARLGYDVTGIDISSDLIEMARERLQRVPYGVDHEANLRYRFLIHDIEDAPLDEIFDVVICYDSLHHFENEHAVLRHVAAMLEYGGLLFVLEGDCPPQGSPAEEELRSVMRQYETLESPFDRDYLLQLLAEHGFAIVGDYASINGLFERDLIKGECLPSQPLALNYLLCKKIVTRGSTTRVSMADSRRPDMLRARLTPVSEWRERVAPGALLQLSFEVENTGNTLWLVSSAALKGTIRPGIKILDEAGRTIDEFHGAPPMPRALAPGERATLSLNHPAPNVPGAYTIKIDLVNQDICWFEQQGSQPLMLPFQVRP